MSHLLSLTNSELPGVDGDSHFLTRSRKHGCGCGLPTVQAVKRNPWTFLCILVWAVVTLCSLLLLIAGLYVLAENAALGEHAVRDLRSYVAKNVDAIVASVTGTVGLFLVWFVHFRSKE